MTTEDERAPAVRAWLAPGIVLFAVGAKLGLVRFFGSDQPYADQWAGEGAALFRSSLYGRLGWLNFFGPYGEHHPALTRIMAWGLFRLNGRQWDARVEMVANLLVYAAFLWVFWRLAARVLGGRWSGPAAIAAAVLFALPANRENFLWGFQSQFLLLLLCGVAHILGTIRADRLGLRWAGAQLAGLAGLFSIAAGPASAAALAVWAGWRIARGGRRPLNWATLAANLLLVGVGLWLLPPAAAGPPARADSPGGLVLAWGWLLSWPLPGPWWCAWVYLPLAILLALRPRAAGGDGGLLMVSGAWVALVALAIAFGRGAHPDAIAVRYYDILVVGLYLNGLAAAKLVLDAAAGRRRLVGRLALLWVALVAWPLYRMNQPQEVGPLLARHRAVSDQQAAAIAKLFATRDPAALSADPEVRGRFPHLQLAVDLLLDPRMRPLLAPSLTADGHAGPLSRWAPRIASLWWLLLAAGAGLLAVGVVPPRFGVASRRAFFA